jgi:hypothetical protein
VPQEGQVLQAVSAQFEQQSSLAPQASKVQVLQSVPAQSTSQLEQDPEPGLSPEQSPKTKEEKPITKNKKLKLKNITLFI